MKHCSCKIIQTIIFVLLISSCRDFVINKTIIGKIHLIATDSHDNLSVSYSLENGDYSPLIAQTVFAVGYNERYLIAKQHPHKFTEQLDKKTTNYYIIPVMIQNPAWAEKEIIGPLTQIQFEQKSKELHIENIKFTIVYKDLE